MVVHPSEALVILIGAHAQKVPLDPEDEGFLWKPGDMLQLIKELQVYGSAEGCEVAAPRGTMPRSVRELDILPEGTLCMLLEVIQFEGASEMSGTTVLATKGMSGLPVVIGFQHLVRVSCYADTERVEP